MQSGEVSGESEAVWKLMQVVQKMRSFDMKMGDSTSVFVIYQDFAHICNSTGEEYPLVRRF